jgi:hypothetical protein
MDRAAIALFPLAALLVCAAPAAGEPADAEKRRDIEEILRVVRWDPGPDRVPELVAGLRTVYPQVPEREWGEVERVAREVPDPRERMVSLYARLYTGDEIRQMLAFYRSPLGQKMLVSGALTTTEGVVGKQEYFIEVGRRIESVLRQGGYQMHEPAAPPASRDGGRLTIDENGRVLRRPKVVQPNG